MSSKLDSKSAETGCKVSDDLSWLNPSFNYAALRNLLSNFVFNQIGQVSEKFAINSNLRLAHFLGQCAHESANFKRAEENLNYSAAGLLRVFGKYFDAETAQKFAMQPQKIAARVYANRMGNGDEASGEGYKFRGRGYIQLTGKSNYASFSADFGSDCVANPDLVASQFPLASAAWFFAKNNLNQIADLGEGDEVIKKITLKINGGTNGLKERGEWFRKFYDCLSVSN